MRHINAFQGNLKKKKYFEGYYYKISQGDISFSIIVGVILGKDPHSFIQVLESFDSYYIRYPLEAFKYEKKKLEIKIENNIFTNEYMELDINTEDLIFNGRVNFKDIVPYKNIMGFFKHFPFMECKHHIVHLSSLAEGKVKINNNEIILDNANSYIEKDLGRSFPKHYIWLQGHNHDDDVSVLFSTAKIPYLGLSFEGIISCIKYGDKIINISTYNRAELVKKSKQQVIILNKKYTLTINILEFDSKKLIAPANGKMEKEILESVNGRINFILKDKKDNILFDTICENCGIEFVE